MADITLTASMRSNLLSLQQTQSLMDMTQERLSTGKKVNSAIDNPSSYFAAQSLTNRANDLSSLLDSMGQGIQTIKAADEAIKTVTDFAEQAKAVANSARDTTATGGREAYAKQFDNILAQLDLVAKDAGYKGVNLLAGDSLTIAFNEDRTSKLDVAGKEITAEKLGVTVAAATWVDGDAGTSVIDTAITAIDTAIGKLRDFASELGNNYSIVQSRESFTESLVNVLEEGADKLTLADMNEESANMLALQTRQQLAINSLSLASQANQSVLKLF